MILESLLRFLLGNNYYVFCLYLEKDLLSLDEFEIRITYQLLSLLVLMSLFFILNILPLWVYLILLIIVLPIVIFTNITYIYYKEYLRQKEIETQLSDFLLNANMFPPGTDIIEIMRFISKYNKTILSKEFSIAVSQINNGFSVNTVLNEIKQRNASIKLHRVIDVLKLSYNSGSNLSNIFEKLSHEIQQDQTILREKANGLAIPKYTLLLSSGILIPMILKWVLKIISEIDLGLLNSYDLISNNVDLIAQINYIVYIYIFEFVLISSIFIAIIDGNWKKFIVYLIILLPLAYIIFIFI
jgi:hypothetical protein